MPLCPRCQHPAEHAPTICTQCGSSVPSEAGQPQPFATGKILLGLLLVVLVAWLLMLAIELVQGVRGLGQ